MRKIFMSSSKCEIFDPKFPLPNISFINHVVNQPAWMAGPVKHDDWCEVVYINKGKAYYTIDHKTYTVTKGDLIIFNEGMVHDARSDRDDPVERWSCAFRELKLVNREFNHIIPKGASPVIPIGDKGNLLNSFFQIIIDACTTPSKNTYNICQHAICTILSFIDDLGGLPANGYRSEKYSLANEIISYIDENYSKSLSLRFLAKEFFISPDYLSHIVKKELGISPIDYVISRRIGEAQHLLMSTLLPVSVIAEMVGYPNINHFSIAFRKKLGVSPGLFRKNLNINFMPSNSYSLNPYKKPNLL